jgi:eukaryotic-like serine/threonine-protein kinase
MNRRFQNNEKIGDYRVVGFIGQGGMGEVYHAIHEKLGRSAAVKVLGAGAVLEESYKTRFLNEARLQASLHHPHIATLYDFQEVGNELLIFMEFVDGEGLDGLIERNYFSIEESLKIFESIVEAIKYVHDHGIIHRDIKTENVKLTVGGVPKLLDFGIAKDPKSQSLTQVGGVIGTPNYLAPEQLEGCDASAQTDIWSLGVLLYKMLTGKVPFESDLLEGLVYQISQGKLNPPENINPAIPKSVADIVKKCLARDVRQRYQTTDEVLADVKKVLNDRYSNETFLNNKLKTGSPLPIKTISAVAGSVLVFLSLVAVGIWAVGGSPEKVVENKIPIRGKTVEIPTKDVPVEKKNEPPIAQTDKKNESKVTQIETSKEKRTVRIDAIGGTAEVWRSGQKIGNTPLDIEIMDQEVVNLKLKRPGFEDSDVQIAGSVGKRVYTFSLSPK